MSLMSQFGETPEETATRLAAEQLSKETAEKKDAADKEELEKIKALDLKEIRDIAKGMEAKLFLSREDLEKALKDIQEGKTTNLTPPPEKQAGEKDTPAPSTTEAPTTINPITGAVTSSERTKETLASAIASGAIAADPNNTDNGALTQAQRETLRERATAAMSGDLGDKIAASRVIAALNSGNDLNLPTLAMQMQTAVAAMDQVRTVVTKNGTKLTVTTADDGDGTPERVVERDNTAAALAILMREQQLKDTEQNRQTAEGVALAAILAALASANRSGEKMKDFVVAGMDTDSSHKSPNHSPMPIREATPALPSFG